MIVGRALWPRAIHEVRHHVVVAIILQDLEELLTVSSIKQEDFNQRVLSAPSVCYPEDRHYFAVPPAIADESDWLVPAIRQSGWAGCGEFRRGIGY